MSFLTCMLKESEVAFPLYFLVRLKKGVMLLKYSAQYFIEHLKLAEHPEGGYYISSFRASDNIAVRDVQRPIYTSIYFLLRSQDISHLHRLQSDELWYYHAGSP